MKVLAIDPGTTESAWCLLDDDGSPIRFGKAKNQALLDMLRMNAFGGMAEACVQEMVASYGMAVGQDVYRTVWWAGRFAEAWAQHEDHSPPIELFRKEIVVHLCGSARAKDKNVRAALIDRFGKEGGQSAAIGRKANPGPLYGVSADVWSALAIGITAQDRMRPVSNSEWNHAIYAGGP